MPKEIPMVTSEREMPLAVSSARPAKAEITYLRMTVLLYYSPHDLTDASAVF
jgi:hypothetical protein